MPAVGKEVEQTLTPEITTQNIEPEGYVERVEKRVENAQPSGGVVKQTKPSTDVPVVDMGKLVSSQLAVETKPNIILPLGKQEVVEGLHHSVYEGVRWAAEWCLEMIKKYPGRVFYLPPKTDDQ